MSETALTALDPTAALDAIETAVGGRQKLLDALALVPQTDAADDPITYVIRAISDPAVDRRKLSSICRAAGITVPEFLDALKQGQYATMLVRVQTTVARETPGVVEDVLVRAQPHHVTCPDCHGTLQVRDSLDRTKPQIPCKRCLNAEGQPTGLVYVLPDLDRQELALKVANLLPKAGPLVGIVNQAAPSPIDPTPAGFGHLLKGMDALMARTPGPVPAATPTPDIIDAEPAAPVDRPAHPD